MERPTGLLLAMSASSVAAWVQDCMPLLCTTCLHTQTHEFGGSGKMPRDESAAAGATEQVGPLSAATAWRPCAPCSAAAPGRGCCRRCWGQTLHWQRLHDACAFAREPLVGESADPIGSLDQRTALLWLPRCLAPWCRCRAPVVDSELSLLHSAHRYEVNAAPRCFRSCTYIKCCRWRRMILALLAMRLPVHNRRKVSGAL